MDRHQEAGVVERLHEVEDGDEREHEREQRATTAGRGERINHDASVAFYIRR